MRHEHPLSRRTARVTLFVVCAATAMLMLDIAVVNTALAHIASDLHSGLGGVQWVVDAYTVALAATVLTAGSIADRVGRRLVFTLGLGLFTAASLASGLAMTIFALDVSRGVQGIGAAAMFATSLALLADAFPGHAERARALAAYGATIGASFAVGPLVGGALTSGAGWRWIFLINLPIGLVCAVATLRTVRESRDPQPRRVDTTGQVLLIGGLFLLVLGLLRGNVDGWSSPGIIAALTSSCVLLGAFAVVQSRGHEPMLPLSFFSNRSFTGAQLAALGIAGSFFALYLYATLYLQVVLGMSPIRAGLVYLPGTVLVFVVSGATAPLATRVPARTLLGGGLVAVAAGLALMTLVGTQTSWAVLLPGLLLACFGTGLFNPSVRAVTLAEAPAHRSGLATGINDTFAQAGIAVGVAMLGALVPADAALGNGSAAAFVDGFHHALLVGAAIAAAGAIASLVMVRSHTDARAVSGETLAEEPAAA